MAQNSKVAAPTFAAALKLQALETDLEKAADLHARRWTLQALFNHGRLRETHLRHAARETRSVMGLLASGDELKNISGRSALWEMRGHFNWRVSVQLDNDSLRGATEDRKFERRMNEIVELLEAGENEPGQRPKSTPAPVN